MRLIFTEKGKSDSARKLNAPGLSFSIVLGYDEVIKVGPGDFDFPILLKVELAAIELPAQEG